MASSSANLTRSLKAAADKPQVARETAYYLDNIEKVKSIDDFLADDRIFAYAMKAFGLGDMTYAKAFMRKVLTEGIASSDTFANKLADKRYREFADTFNFAAVRRHHHDLRRHPAGHRRSLRAPDRWRRTPAARTRACGWRSISSARPPI